MKKQLLSLILIFAAANANATSTNDEAMVECTLTTGTSGLTDNRGELLYPNFEELSLNFRTTQGASDIDENGDEIENIFYDYVMKYSVGNANSGQRGESRESSIFGNHEEYTEVIFTSSNADSDGVVVTGRESYRMTMNIGSSQINVDLRYVGQDQDDFATYTMVWSGYGPAYGITDEKITERLAASEEYGDNDNPLLCVAHYDLDGFVTQ